VVTPSDLIVLKLYAAGPQDAWDIIQLVTGPERQSLIREVDGMLASLPEDSQKLWRRLVTERTPGDPP
jgi:hypothetical protein